MRTVNTLPRKLRPSELVWITMRDGVRLSARLWLPELEPDERVPAIVDCHPYRVTDSSAVRDSRVYPYFAGHGYACLRVDLRGSGNSEGLLLDEYLAQEQDDGEDVLAWLGEQPWCTGDAGWIGISWSGFAGLQVAARRPPQLKALITICSTDDRYADDVHYRGGCVLASDMLPWASTMLMLNALPPDPDVVGLCWRETWLDRLENTPPYIEPWLRHQLRDDYWKHGSVCEHYSAITAPTLVVGGWADGYVDAVPRLMDGLTCPRKAIIGPWGHGSPLDALPGPNIGFLQECLRWWDQWLKGIDSGVTTDPDLRAWMQDSVGPATFYAERPGRWLAMPWPPPTEPGRRYLGGAGDELSPLAPSVPVEYQHRGRLWQSADPGAWCPSGAPGDWPGDQRAGDANCLSFTSAPLGARVQILGNAVVELELAVDQPEAEIVVRLCDVAPDGASLLVTRGVLNLCHRDGHERVESLVAGEFYRVAVPLKAVAHEFPRGHRMRIAVGSSYFPWLWPSPDPVELRLRTGVHTNVTLPYLPAGSASLDVAFAEPEQAARIPIELLSEGASSRGVSRADDGTLFVPRISGSAPTVRLPDAGGLSFSSNSENSFSVIGDDPLTARVFCRNSATRERGDWRIEVRTESEMTATRDEFVVNTTVQAFESGELVFERSREFRTPRV